MNHETDSTAPGDLLAPIAAAARPSRQGKRHSRRHASDDRLSRTAAATRPRRLRLPSIRRLTAGWGRLRPLLGNRTATVLILVAASVGAGLAEAAVLALIAQVAAAMVAHSSHVGAGLGPLSGHRGLGAGLMVALVLAGVRLALQLVVAWLPARVSADVQARLRRELFDGFSRASWAVQADERDGHLQELMTNQVMQASQAVLNVAGALSGAAMFLALTASAFALNVLVAVLVLVTATAMFAVLRPLNRVGRTAAADVSAANVEHAAGVSESGRLAEEAHVFGTAAAHRQHVGALIETARSAYFRFQLTGRLVQSLYQGLVIMLIVAGLGALYVAGAGNLAALGAVILILVRAATYGQQFQGGYHALIQTLPYLDRLEGAIDRYRASTPPDGGRPLSTIRSLTFDRVDFAYRPERPVLRRVSFQAHAGEAIGVVGPSGAGKSTLVQVLLRLREPDTGLYLLNGAPAPTFARADWQRRVAYVAQEPRIMHATVADNIRYFRDLDDAAIVRAARMAHIHDDILRMQAGYRTVVGQRADAVSGGQRQRICLARALAAEPDILVLDEPTSALDPGSEAAIQASLADLHGLLTLFIVAHRLSTLNICDRVLVLVDGAVEAFASPTELQDTNAFYRQTGTLAGRAI